MPTKGSSHLRAVLLALFVTFLWSTSWVLIKFGLEDVPALPFAGLRYTLAFLVLLPLAIRSGQLESLRTLSAGGWLRLALLGVVYYAVTQGAQYAALVTLPAMTLSLLLNFSALVVAALGIITLGECPTVLQWIGVGLFLAGVVLYFYPVDLSAGQGMGLALGVVCMLAASLSTVLGRAVNRKGTLTPLAVTTTSMGIGSLLLLVGGVAMQGLPRLSPMNWLIVVWLAMVNSAMAFTWWNRTQRVLTAVESSVINNTMLIQIAVLAWLFLGERLTEREALGLLAAAVGSIVVQLRRQRSPAALAEETLPADHA